MMDDEDVTHHPNSFAINFQNHPVKNANYPQSDYDDDDDDDCDDDDYDKSLDNEQDNGDDDDDNDDDDDDDEARVQRIKNDDSGYKHDCSNSQKHPKKKRLKTLIPSYEFAPRALPAPQPSSNHKPSSGGRNPLTDWTEHETLVLLEAWGERFLKQGRKSLRSEEWQEVSEKVSQESRIERTDTQCRNRLDTLKKKYKKEKAKLISHSQNDNKGDKGFMSDWIYFKKMDALLSPAPSLAGLSCGLDSGEGPENYPGRSNSGSGGSEKGAKACLRPRRSKNGKDRYFKLLADSFRKFSDTYEKIERGKREQMAELERMRIDFHRDLELQKRKILERAQAEIARIRQGDEDDDHDVSG